MQTKWGTSENPSVELNSHLTFTTMKSKRMTIPDQRQKQRLPDGISLCVQP